MEEEPRDPLLEAALATADGFADESTFWRRTHTTFVLPFHYRLRTGESCDDCIAFVESPPSYAVPRQTYFTPDTVHALFRRARWCRLHEHASTSARHPVRLSLTVGGLHSHGSSERSAERTMSVALGAPELVLFEGNAHSMAADDGANDALLHATDVLRVGFLLVDAFPLAVTEGNQTSAPSLDDLLRFNEVFRMLASGNQPEYKRYVGRLGANSGISVGKSPEVFRVDEKGLLGLWQWLLERPVLLPGGGYAQLVRAGDTAAARAVLKGPVATPASGWLAHSDNRAFVWTAAVLAAETQVEAQLEPNLRHGKFTHSEGWVSLLNVDQADAGEPSPFEREWVEQRTYTRWAESGTYYGFCQHAGAYLTSERAPAYLTTVWRHQYLDQTLLLLYLRTVAFGMSSVLAKESIKRWDTAYADRDEEVESEEQQLRDALAFVTNVYRYPLYSNQQQGEELFVRSRDALGVDHVFSAIEAQVATTDQLLRERWQTKLNRVAAIVQIASVVATAGGLTALALEIPKAMYDKDAPPTMLMLAVIGVGLAGGLRLLRDALDDFHRWWKRGDERRVSR